jgi:hypothetical protein
MLSLGSALHAGIFGPCQKYTGCTTLDPPQAEHVVTVCYTVGNDSPWDREQL